MRFVTPAILLLTTGCGGADGNQQQAAAAKEQAAVAAGFKPGGPAPMETVSVDPAQTSSPGATLPPATMQYRFIGRWAATVPLCRDGAWTFETSKLTTAGKTSCAFDNVAAMMEGYRLEGTCTAEGAEGRQTLELSFDESRKRMLVAGETLGPVELLYCGA